MTTKLRTNIPNCGNEFVSNVSTCASPSGKWRAARGIKKVNTSTVVDTPISPWLKANRDVKFPRDVVGSVSERIRTLFEWCGIKALSDLDLKVTRGIPLSDRLFL